MEWVSSLRGQVVGPDTAPLIYLIEEHPVYEKIVTPFFEAIEHGEFSVVTSIVTLVEVLVHPIKHGNATLAQKYRELLFDTQGLTTIQLNQDIAEKAAWLRGRHKIQAPDAIQMATAINASASFFLTNDIYLSSIPGLQVLVLDKLKAEPSS